MKKRFISVGKDTKEFLCKSFECSERMVRKALNYDGDSELAQRIRKVALDRGGLLCRNVPDCETVFAGGHMVQTFGNGVVIDVNLEAGTMKVSRGGVVLDRVSGVTIKRLTQAQQSAESMDPVMK